MIMTPNIFINFVSPISFQKKDVMALRNFFLFIICEMLYILWKWLGFYVEIPRD